MREAPALITKGSYFTKPDRCPIQVGAWRSQEKRYLFRAPILRTIPMTPRWVPCFALAFCLGVPWLSGQNFNANSELSLGIAAYEKAKYRDAIDHFERAVTLDPRTVTGHFYLAEAYDNAYSEECDWDCDANERRRLRAIEEFKKVLELDPSNTEALKTLAWRYYRSAKSGPSRSLLPNNTRSRPK